MTAVLGVRLDETTCSDAATQIVAWAGGTESRYVCVANVHALMEAFDSAAFRDVLNSADMVVPDGMPLVWMMRLKGARAQSRVYGPDLMRQMLHAAGGENIPVGLYGSTQHVLDSLAESIVGAYPEIRVVYRESPPFGEHASSDDSEACRRISRSGARILFVGLGCPKQELWMAAHRDKIPAVMVGVGAAFDFLAGTKKQAPRWIGMLGLEWLFRLIQEPRRLWKRYLYHNPRFVVLALAELLGVWKP